jgi:hypothetical protein
MNVSTRLIVDGRIRSEMPGTIKPVSVDWEGQRAVRTPDREKRVLDRAHSDAEVSTRQAGKSYMVRTRTVGGHYTNGCVTLTI